MNEQYAHNNFFCAYQFSWFLFWWAYSMRRFIQQIASVKKFATLILAWIFKKTLSAPEVGGQPIKRKQKCSI